MRARRGEARASPAVSPAARSTKGGAGQYSGRAGSARLLVAAGRAGTAGTRQAQRTGARKRAARCVACNTLPPTPPPRGRAFGFPPQAQCGVKGAAAAAASYRAEVSNQIGRDIDQAGPSRSGCAAAPTPPPRSCHSRRDNNANKLGPSWNLSPVEGQGGQGATRAQGTPPLAAAQD